MPDPLITTLIDKVDNVELVRDQIAAILLLEATEQQAIADATEGKDPRLWALRVFLERSDPWSEFLEVPDAIDALPIVNVSFETESAEQRASNVVERQKMVGTFNVDCYGYGIASSTATGHMSGDEAAAVEAMRAVRLARNILMSGPYTYLGMNKVVWRRWMASMTPVVPAEDDRPVERVAACRLVLEVEFSEFSPQHVAETLDLVSATVKRQENGEIYFSALYGDDNDS